MSRTVNTNPLDTSTSIAYLQASNGVQVDRIVMSDITAVIAGANQANIVFTAAVTDICTTATAHGFTTGAKVTATTTVTLPAGLAAATDYYVIVLSSTTFSLATSQANALAGTAIDITGTGTGVHTIAVTTTLAGTIKLQKNNNPSDVTAVWVDLEDTEVYNGNNSRTISAAATVNWLIDVLAARELRAYVTITSGTVTANVRVHGKGY